MEAKDRDYRSLIRKGIRIVQFESQACSKKKCDSYGILPLKSGDKLE